MTLQQALDIVNDNENGVAHNFWKEYLPAVLIVNEAYPVKGYTTVEEDGHEFDLREYRQEQNEAYDRREK